MFPKIGVHTRFDQCGWSMVMIQQGSQKREEMSGLWHNAKRLLLCQDLGTCTQRLTTMENTYPKRHKYY